MTGKRLENPLPAKPPTANTIGNNRISTERNASCLEMRLAPDLRQVEAVEIHHFGPGFDKVLDEFLFAIGLSIKL